MTKKFGALKTDIEYPYANSYDTEALRNADVASLAVGDIITTGGKPQKYLGGGNFEDVGGEQLFDHVVDTEVQRENLTGLTAGDVIFVKESGTIYKVNTGATTGSNPNVNSNAGITSQQLFATNDLNDVIETGFYYCASTATATAIGNTPINAAFLLLVENTGTSSIVKQTFTRFATGTPTVYVRTKYVNTWGAWVNMTPAAGSTPASTKAALKTQITDGNPLFDNETAIVDGEVHIDKASTPIFRGKTAGDEKFALFALGTGDDTTLRGKAKVDIQAGSSVALSAWVNGIVSSPNATIAEIAAAGSSVIPTREYIEQVNETYIKDIRGAARAPSYFKDRAVSWGFASVTELGLPVSGDLWAAVQTISKWTGYNNAHRQSQIAHNGDKVYTREANSDAAWGAWKDLTDAGTASAGPVSDVIYTSPALTVAGLNYTLTHNLGLTQADLEGGKYSIRVMFWRFGAQRVLSDSSQWHTWTAANPPINGYSSWQPNVTIVRPDELFDTMKVQIIRNY